MKFRVENEEIRRTRQETPHRVFVFAKKLQDDHGDLWVLFEFVLRRWRSGHGFEFNVGDGIWRCAYEVAY